MSGEAVAIEIRPKERDATLLISQNNRKRTVKIVEISEVAAEMLGYVHQELEGLPLQTILGSDACETMEELLEYDDAGDDLDTVLRRIAGPKLKRYNGEEMPVALRIFRAESRDQNHWFRMVVKDERRQIADAQPLQGLAEHFAGVRALDEASGLPNRESCASYLKMLQNHAHSQRLDSCFAVLRIDRHEKNLAHYGRAGCIQLLRHAASICRATFRSEDVVCHLADDKIGLFLLNISPESARMVLGRLRWNIRGHRIEFGGKSDFSITVSVVMAPIHLHGEEDLLAACEAQASAIEADERNLLIEYQSG